MGYMADLVELGVSSLEESVMGANGVDIFRQTYEQEPLPFGVVTVECKQFPDERGGYIFELARLKSGFIKSLEEKGVRHNISDGQLNVSVISPGTERFGHVHRGQDELWVVALGYLTVPLFDIRRRSSTHELRTKIQLTSGKGVFIPHGVVHGLGNYGTTEAVLIYVPNLQFSAGKDTQEWRVVPQDPKFWDFAKPDPI